MTKPNPPSTPELLAPAGEPAAAFAAFEYGADAIYTGLPQFSARAGAVNVNANELQEIVAFAHRLERRRRVYVTMNTLIRDAEQSALIDSLAVCVQADVDAIIVQDLGVLRLARTFFPQLRLHASTQLAIHNLEGVLEAAAQGFQRVTLARELTREEIHHIVRHSPIEIESFVYGALCYSYSGLCMYSALLRDGSGNRGSCAYPCRDLFWPADNTTPTKQTKCHHFSMKDFRLTPEHLSAMCQTDVHSLKIEGRKKSPLYVAAVVNHYRKLLDGAFRGTESRDSENNIQTIFSRRQTSLYVDGHGQRSVTDPGMVGHRGALLGAIERIDRGHIGFRPLLPLQVHDGIQIELPDSPKPFGFSVQEIRAGKKRERIFEAAPGQWVEVPVREAPASLNIGMKLFLASSQAVKQRYAVTKPNPKDCRPERPVDVSIRVTPAQILFIAREKTRSGRTHVFHSVENRFEAPKSPEKNRDAIHRSFQKLGDTPFALRSFRLSAGIPFIPVSLLNEIRRNLMEQLEYESARSFQSHLQQQKNMFFAKADSVPEVAPIEKPARRWILQTDQPGALAELKAAHFTPLDEVLLTLGREPVAAVLQALDHLDGQVPVRIGIPPLMRMWEAERLAPDIQTLLGRGQIRWELNNVYGFHFFQKREAMDLSANWPLYAFNAAAVAQLQDMGVRRFVFSPEDSIENITGMARRFPYQGAWTVWRDTPLFISETCPVPPRCARPCQHGDTCGATAEQTWTNARHEHIRVVHSSGVAGRTWTLNEAPSRVPPDPTLPVLWRADFHIRRWTPETLRRTWEELLKAK